MGVGENDGQKKKKLPNPGTQELSLQTQRIGLLMVWDAQSYAWINACMGTWHLRKFITLNPPYPHDAETSHTNVNVQNAIRYGPRSLKNYHASDGVMMKQGFHPVRIPKGLDHPPSRAQNVIIHVLSPNESSARWSLSSPPCPSRWSRVGRCGQENGPSDLPTDAGPLTSPFSRFRHH